MTRNTSRFVVEVGPNGHGTIRTRVHVPRGLPGSVYSTQNGLYVIGYIFWSGAMSDFYTVELRNPEAGTVVDDSAFFIAGMAETFDSAVYLASEILAERLEIV